MRSARLLSFLLIIVVWFSAVTTMAQEAKTLSAQANAAYNQKDYAKSAELYAAASERGDLDPETFYNAACAYALSGQSEKAFQSLENAMARGVIVGEPTGGSTGQPLFFKLPGGGSARVCTKCDTYPDGRAFVGIGIQPNKLVTPTVADLRAGRDTVLEAALAQLKMTAKK